MGRVDRMQHKFEKWTMKKLDKEKIKLSNAWLKEHMHMRNEDDRSAKLSNFIRIEEKEREMMSVEDNFSNQLRNITYITDKVYVFENNTNDLVIEI